MLAKYLREGMPAGKPTLPQSVTAPGGDPAAALWRLKAAAERFATHGWEYRPSPLFGPLSRDEALKVRALLKDREAFASETRGDDRALYRRIEFRQIVEGFEYTTIRPHTHTRQNIFLCHIPSDYDCVNHWILRTDFAQ